MDSKEHFRRVNRYYEHSKLGYNILLGGSKHFGFHPKNRKVSEKEAQLLMQDLIGEKLRLSKKMKVLDAGCGQGVVSTYLAKKFGCSIEGITIVPFEIKMARRLAEKNQVSEKVNYSYMDYSDMKFRNGYFDAVYTTETLSHSVDIRKTLGEFFRVLKKGGRMALFEYTVAEDARFSDYERNMLNKVMRSTATEGIKQFRHDKFQNVIAEAGFKNVKVQNISQNAEASLNRLRRFAVIPYFFVKLFGLQESHPNTTAAVEFYKMAKKDLIRFNVFTAEK